MTVNLQAAQSLPYSYGFEDNDLATDGWTKSSANTANESKYGILAEAKHEGDYGFRFSSYSQASDYNQYLFSPELTADKGVVVQFYYKNSSTSGSEKFKVGYSTTNTDPASFTWGDEIVANTNSWILLDEFVCPAGTKYVAINYYSNYLYYLYVDDITFSAPTSCKKPTDLAVGDKTSTTAVLSWTAGASEKAWDICVNGDEEHLVEATTNPFTLSDLTPGTQYSVKVRANCGGEVSGWSSAVSFPTDCAAITSFPWSENFDACEAGNGKLPLCWSRINASTSSSYNYYPYVYNYSYYAHSGSNMLYFYTYYSSWSDYDPQDQYAILPEMNNVAGKQITFWAKGSSTGYVLKVGSIEDPADASTFHEIASKTLTSSYAEYIVELTGAVGNYIALKVDAANSSSSSKSIYVDDILVENIPSCKKPADLAESNVSTNTAVLSWTSNASAWQICVNNDEENLIDANANPFTLNNLTANTAYSVKVRANCGATDKSDWSDAITFRTACANVTVLPWSDDFEGYDANTIPFCWDNSASASTTINSTPSYIWGVYSDNDNKLLRMYNFMVQAGTALINSPVIELPASPAQQLTFDYAHNASCADLTVKISEDNGENWTALQSYTKSGTNDYNHAGEMTEATISLADYAGKTIMLQFFTTADYSQGGIFLDNISIHEVPSCSKPEVNAPVILPDGATISWTAGNGETRFEYACVAKGAEVADADWILLDENVLTVSIHGKASGTECDVYVRAYCSASEKSEAVKKTFKALCPAPTALQVTDIASKSATISWTAAEGISNYQYVVMAGDDAADWTSATLVEGAVTANLTNLTAATSYTVYVRSHYSDVSYSSAISKDFTTECEAFNLPLSENFNDLYSGIPNCWDNSEGTSTYSSKWNSYSTGHEGRGLRFDSYDNGRNKTNVLATPTIHLDKDAILSFWCKNPNGGAYEVKIAQAGSETRATLFDDLTSISAWTQKEADLSAYTGKDVVIYFCGTSNYGSYDAYLYLDDVEIYEKPACSKPSALQISNIETTSATIAWTAGGSETAWQICLNGDEEHLIDADANPFTLTDLTASTAYSVKVRAICGSEDMSDWSNAADFRTECANITILPWNENLESLDANTVPACWDNSASTTTDLSSYPYYVWGVYEYSSNKMLRMNNYSLHTGTAQINTPVIELPASPAYELTFDYSHTATCGDFVVKVSADNGANWSNVKTLTKGSGSSYTDPGDFITETVSLADYAGKSIMLQFFANANWGSGAIFVDNLSIHEVPSCAKPSDVQISNIAQSSATIAWTAGGYETAWQICLNGDEENLIDADANPFELTNLAANTAYSVKVRAICDAEDLSDWSNAANFRTECGAMALPFIEDFENGIDCWKLVDCDGGTGKSTDAKKEGSYGFKFRYNYYPPQYLISPELVAVSDSSKVEFYAKKSGSYDETFQIGYSTTTNDETAFTWDAEDNHATSSWELYSKDLPAGVKYVAVKFTAYNTLALYIDDFSVTVKPAPETPTAVDNIVNGVQIIKRIENGLLLIEVNGVIYNAQGEVVTK